MPISISYNSFIYSFSNFILISNYLFTFILLINLIFNFLILAFIFFHFIISLFFIFIYFHSLIIILGQLIFYLTNYLIASKIRSILIFITAILQITIRKIIYSFKSFSRIIINIAS